MGTSSVLLWKAARVRITLVSPEVRDFGELLGEIAERSSAPASTRREASAERELLGLSRTDGDRVPARRDWHPIGQRAVTLLSVSALRRRQLVEQVTAP